MAVRAVLNGVIEPRTLRIQAFEGQRPSGVRYLTLPHELAMELIRMHFLKLPTARLGEGERKNRES